MLEIATAAFLVAHGAIHLSFAAPKPDDPRYPFVPERTWFSSAVNLDATAARTLFVTVAPMSALAYLAAGVGVLVDASWFAPFAVAGSIASLVTLTLGFHPWLVFGIAIDAAIIAGVVAEWPQAPFS